MAGLVSGSRAAAMRKAGESGRTGGREMARLEAVYRRHVRAVYTLCLRLLADVKAAEDATLRVFARLGREIARLWDESRIAGRLRDLSIEEALRQLRAGSAARAKGRVEDEGTVRASTGEAFPADPPRPDPAALDVLLARLPDELRVVFVLHECEGLDERAVARAINVEPAEARRLIGEARRELRRLWRSR